MKTSSLWRRVYKIARVRTGEAVALAVQAATDAVWDAGLDERYALAVRRHGMTAANAEAFHRTWLLAFLAALEHAEQLADGACPCDAGRPRSESGHWRHVLAMTIAALRRSTSRRP